MLIYSVHQLMTVPKIIWKVNKCKKNPVEARFQTRTKAMFAMKLADKIINFLLS